MAVALDSSGCVVFGKLSVAVCQDGWMDTSTSIVEKNRPNLGEGGDILGVRGENGGQEEHQGNIEEYRGLPLVNCVDLFVSLLGPFSVRVPGAAERVM